jgi:hypothetical protein
MSTSNKWILVVVMALTLIVASALVAAALFQPSERDVTPRPGPWPTQQGGSDALPTTPSSTLHVSEPGDAADGHMVAYVRPGEGEPTATIDEVEILTGDAAHDAAVEAGVIGADEDLPNDMWVHNDTASQVELPLADNAVIELLSSEVPGEWIAVEFPDLGAVYEGSYDGPAMVTTAAGQALLMEVTVADGEAVQLRAVYQP